jgi:hypothetical protein
MMKPILFPDSAGKLRFDPRNLVQIRTWHGQITLKKGMV